MRTKVDWLARRRECRECQGFGYKSGGKQKHPYRWVVRCKCQPQNMDELTEAAEQEQQVRPHQE